MAWPKPWNDCGRGASPPPVIVVAIHANENRMQEYGAAGRPDYKGRGSKGKSDAGFFAVGIWEALKHVLH